jgi:hypothetical protein
MENPIVLVISEGSEFIYPKAWLVRKWIFTDGEIAAIDFSCQNSSTDRRQRRRYAN